MTIPAGSAASAYAMMARIADNLGGVEKVSTQASSDKGQFSGMLNNALSELQTTGKVADQKAMGLVAGKADVTDVVTAISETELAMETVVTVRDRVIAAYEEIMRMPI